VTINELRAYQEREGERIRSENQQRLIQQQRIAQLERELSDQRLSSQSLQQELSSVSPSPFLSLLNSLSLSLSLEAFS